jgi:chromosome segregation ATPase
MIRARICQPLVNANRVKGGPMNDIAELERRIAYAMERIAKGVEALDKAAPPAQATAADQSGHDDELAQLRAQLTEERLANAQLEERLRVIKQKQQAQAELLDRLHGKAPAAKGEGGQAAIAVHLAVTPAQAEAMGVVVEHQGLGGGEPA